MQIAFGDWWLVEVDDELWELRHDRQALDEETGEPRPETESATVTKLTRDDLDELRKMLRAWHVMETT